jgi:hypothetical protein
MNTMSWLESILKDAGFSLIAILSLALGIGANTAIFQPLNAVRLRSLPVKNPHELVEIKIVGGNGAGSQRVALVNQTFVRHFLRGADPIGRVLTTHPEPGYPAANYQIVGVMADSKYQNLRDEIPAFVIGPAARGDGGFAQTPAGGKAS